VNFCRTEIKGEDVQLACCNHKSFPPKAMFLGLTDIEIHKSKSLSIADKQRWLVWQKVCGLMHMDTEKCLQCPHVRILGFKNGLPVLMSLDKKLATPIVDKTTLEISKRHRLFLDSITPQSQRNGG